MPAVIQCQMLPLILASDVWAELIYIVIENLATMLASWFLMAIGVSSEVLFKIFLNVQNNFLSIYVIQIIVGRRNV